jgi:hypothetical protein
MGCRRKCLLVFRLPDDKDVQTLLRCEANLDKKLYRAITELERVQKQPKEKQTRDDTSEPVDARFAKRSQQPSLESTSVGCKGSQECTSRNGLYPKVFEMCSSRVNPIACMVRKRVKQQV